MDFRKTGFVSRGGMELVTCVLAMAAGAGFVDATGVCAQPVKIKTAADNIGNRFFMVVQT